MRLDQTSIAVGVAIVASGFVTIAATWAAVAARLEVPLQMPYLVSGSFTGLGLIAVGATVVNVQVSRRLNARQRQQLDALLDEANVVREASSEIAADG